MTVHKFKYPKFYSIIYVLGFLMMTTITIGMTLSVIKAGGFLKIEENWGDIVFDISINILLPTFLMLLGVIGVKRLRFSFTIISVDLDKKRLILERGNIYKEVNFDSIKSTKDIPNKGFLILNTDRDTVVIPKEIGRYSMLYGILKQNDLINEKIELEGFKTTLGLFYWIFGTGLLAFSLFPLFMLPDLIINYDGSSNSKTGLIVLPTLGLGIFFMLLLLANRYEINKDSLIKINPLFRKRILYSNIDKIDYNEARRTLTINLINDKLRWLRKINGQTGIVIIEPGNISIERLYLELERRKTTGNKELR